MVKVCEEYAPLFSTAQRGVAVFESGRILIGPAPREWLPNRNLLRKISRSFMILDNTLSKLQKTAKVIAISEETVPHIKCRLKYENGVCKVNVALVKCCSNTNEKKNSLNISLEFHQYYVRNLLVYMERGVHA